MKTLLPLLCTSLPWLSYTSQRHPVSGCTTKLITQPDGSATTRAGIAVEPDAEHEGSYFIRLPAHHEALQVTVLDAHGYPMQPVQVVAAATATLTPDARQWPAGRYQLQFRSASGGTRTSLNIP
jgi:hypothetical protein